MSSLFLIHGDSGAFITDSHAPARSEVHLPSSPSLNPLLPGLSLNPLLPGFWSPLHPAHTERGGSSDCCSLTRLCPLSSLSPSFPFSLPPPLSPSLYSPPLPLLSPYLLGSLLTAPSPSFLHPNSGQAIFSKKGALGDGPLPPGRASQECRPPSLILSFQEHPLSVGV